MALLLKKNPKINSDCEARYLCTCTEAEDRLNHLVSAGAIVATMHTEGVEGYKLYITNLELDHDPYSDIFMATGPKPTVLKAYQAYAQVFCEVD
jgi:hypothetical protein